MASFRFITTSEAGRSSLAGTDYDEFDYYTFNFDNAVNGLTTLYTCMVVESWDELDLAFQAVTGTEWVRVYFLACFEFLILNKSQGKAVHHIFEFDENRPGVLTHRRTKTICEDDRFVDFVGIALTPVGSLTTEILEKEIVDEDFAKLQKRLKKEKQEKIRKEEKEKLKRNKNDLHAELLATKAVKETKKQRRNKNRLLLELLAVNAEKENVQKTKSNVHFELLALRGNLDLKKNDNDNDDLINDGNIDVGISTSNNNDILDNDNKITNNEIAVYKDKDNISNNHAESENNGDANEDNIKVDARRSSTYSHSNKRQSENHGHGHGFKKVMKKTFSVPDPGVYSRSYRHPTHDYHHHHHHHHPHQSNILSQHNMVFSTHANAYSRRKSSCLSKNEVVRDNDDDDDYNDGNNSVENDYSEHHMADPSKTAAYQKDVSFSSEDEGTSVVNFSP
eukprot:Awhi_evm1s14847